MNEHAIRQARAGGRGARRALRSAPDLSMLPALDNRLPFCDIMNEEQVARIDNASLAILEDVGVIFRDEIALEDWRRAGADVRGDRVHLDRGLVRELIATIPEGWDYRARNPARNLPFGGRHAIFVPMTGAPYLRDLEDVRRWPTIADLNTFHKLSHMSPALHSTAHHIVEPMDIKVSHRHLHITLSSMKYSDKTFMGMTTSGRNAEDVMAMCEILFGRETMEETPVVTGNCNGNSPLVWDETMLSAMRCPRSPIGYRPFECWTFGSECDGGFAQFTVAPARETYAVRCAWTDAELASIPCAYSTAENMLHRANIGAETVLITGASGGVSSAAVQLARRRGARLGISSRQLERLFAQHMGASPGHYFLAMRLDRARNMLLQTECSITEIAMVCGFRSASHFSRAYRGHYGRPPAMQRLMLA